MKLCHHAAGSTHQGPGATPPTVTVVSGADNSSDVALVHVELAPGTRMPPHRHSGSDVILTPLEGSVQIGSGDEVIDVQVGDSAIILKDESVWLSNPAESVARVLVAAGPAAFVGGIQEWPSRPVSDAR